MKTNHILILFTVMFLGVINVFAQSDTKQKSTISNQAAELTNTETSPPNGQVNEGDKLTNPVVGGIIFLQDNVGNKSANSFNNNKVNRPDALNSEALGTKANIKNNGNFEQSPLINQNELGGKLDPRGPNGACSEGLVFGCRNSGPNPMPGSPNPTPGGPNLMPGSPNPTPGGGNTGGGDKGSVFLGNNGGNNGGGNTGSVFVGALYL